MILRPTRFAVPNSTTLKLLFNKTLSNDIGVDNVSVSGVEGGISDLRIISVEVKSKVLVITTSPQESSGFYLLKLDHGSFDFKSEDGLSLSNNKKDKEIYFVGYTKLNPIRDRVFRKVSNFYNINNSVISDIISNNVDELYSAQRSVGSLLSDNYIRVKVDDELRIRTSAAKDSLVNENCFKVSRVSKSLSDVDKAIRDIDLSDSSYRKISDNEVISLQETFVEEIVDYKDIVFLSNGIVLKTKSDNIIRLIEAEFSEPEDKERCNGTIGVKYPIGSLKYGMSNDFYDKYNSFKRFDINSGEIFLNNFNYKISANSNIKIKYLYKDKTIRPNLDTVSVSYILKKNYEPISLNTNKFFLKNENIVKENGLTPRRGGISFYKNFSENDKKYFVREAVFDSGKRLESTGDYKVNYQTGSVELYGDRGFGIEEDIILCSYNHKKDLSKDIDFYVNEDYDLFIKYYSIYNSNHVNISYKYSEQFESGVHYLDKTNKESINEYVDNNFIDFFKIKAKNYPISEIFRIVNKTTGEVYQPVYTFNNEITFSGRKSPEFKVVDEERIRFSKSNNERLYLQNLFYNNLKSNGITEVFDSYVMFSEGFYYKNDENTDYYLVLEDNSKIAKIKSFIKNGNVITGANLDAAARFNKFDSIKISNLITEIKLKNDNILAKGSSLGSHLNSSLNLDPSLFKNEIQYSKSMPSKYGEYSVDYSLGKIFASINERDPGHASYMFSSFETNNPRILSVNNLGYKNYKNNVDISYSNTSSEVKILNLQNSIASSSGNIVKNNLTEKYYESLIVLGDKTILTDNNYKKINILDFSKNIESPKNNYFDKNIHRYFENVIDLKIKERSVFYIKDNYFCINTSKKIESIYDIFNVSSQKSVFSLNKFIKSTLVVKRVESSPSTKIFLSSDVSDVKTSDVAIIDGSSYNILSINPISNYIVLDGEVAQADTVSIGIGVSIFEEKFGSVIKISLDDIDYEEIFSYEFDIIYMENDGLSVGDKVFVEFEPQDLSVSYTYVKDEVFLSYQHGDNCLDWSISDSLTDGEIYYVDYEYGALRSSLRKNFGSLTEIPFFNNFELSVDREFYRDALEGTLQSFSNGPIFESYNNLINSITSTSPSIMESFYRGWVLGSDYLTSNKISYSENLKFKPCKYKEGLYFGKEDYCSISSDNKLPISEGTISCWTSNDWLGISNDADIKFNIENIGSENYKYSDDASFNVFSGKNSSVFLRKNITLNNYSKNNVDPVIALKKIKSLSPACNIKSNFKFIFNKSNDYNFSNKSIFDYIINDGNRFLSIEILPIYMGKNTAINFNITDTDFLKAPKFSNKVPLIQCRCIYPNSYELFSFLNNDITIEFSNSVNIKDNFNFKDYNIYNKKYYIQDNDGNIFEVKSFLNNLKNTTSLDWSGNISGLTVSRKPVLSSKSLTKSYIKDDFLVPSGSFKLFVGSLSPIIKTKNSQSFEIMGSKKGFIIDFFKDIDISAEFSAENNLIKISVGFLENNTEKYFYSDLPLIDDFDNYFLGLNSKYLGYIKNNNGIFFSSLNEKRKSSFSISEFRYLLENRMRLSDIYIGGLSKNPRSKEFVLSSDNETIGQPKEYSDGAPGIFIFREEGDLDGYFYPADNYWRVRVNPLTEISVPISVTMDKGEVKSIYKVVELKESISGKISSNYNFYKAGLNKNIIPKISENKSMHLRYNNGSLIEDGWSAVGKSFSDEIIASIDGVSLNNYRWFSKSKISSKETLDGTLFDTKDLKQSISTRTLSMTGDFSFSIKSYVSLDLSRLKKKIKDTDRGYYSGISPFVISSEDYTFSSEFILDQDGNQAILISDENKGESISLIKEKWNGVAIDLKIKADKVSNKIFIYVNNTIKASIDFNFKKSMDTKNISIGLRKKGYYQGSYSVTVSKLEFITNDEFIYAEMSDEINIGENHIDFDFSDEVLVSDDGYGYKEDITEILFVSERKKYLFDSGDENSNISLYKNGYGYLNFEISDKKDIYRVSYDISEIDKNSINNIAAAWNTNNSGKKMSMYFNGMEVPKVYTIGSKTPIFSDDRFGDISKERLQNEIFSLIDYGVSSKARTFAGTNQMSSSFITEEDIGRSLIVRSSDLYEDLVGSYIYISDFKNSIANIKNGITGEDFIFTTSSDVDVSFPPTVGLSQNIVTNFSDDKYKIYVDGNPIICSEYTDSEQNPSSDFGARVNLTKNFIEFLGINEECKYFDSIDFSSEVHIRTYGLNSNFISKKIDISSDTEDVTSMSKYNFIISKIDTSMPRPKSISGVKVRKIFEENLVPDFFVDSYFINWKIEIDHEFKSDLLKYSCSNFNENLEGKNLELDIFSYNTSFEKPFYIKIIGDSKTKEESIMVTKSGKYFTNKKFRSIERMTCSMEIIDVDEEPFSISIREKDYVTSNDIKIFKYSNGSFIFGKNQEEYESYDLSTGVYEINYKSPLDFSVDKFGKDLFIGNNKERESGWNGVIEEFKVSNKFFKESDSYKEYIATKPFCPDKSMLSLIPFNNPIDLQQEELRKEVFLGLDNFKFRLDSSQISDLKRYINDKQKFIGKLYTFGISRDIAEKTFVKCHKAYGGPIFDISKFYPHDDIGGNRSGPNEYFSGSVFKNGTGISVDTSNKIIDNNEFSISGWISPSFDSETNLLEKFIFDISNVKESVVYEKNNTLTLPERAESILKIVAVTKSGSKELSDSRLYGKYNIVGATGSNTDFSKGYRLGSDKRTIYIPNKLPNKDIGYRVYFVPLKSKLESVSLYLSKDSQINLDIKSSFKDITLSEEFYFDYSRWYKFLFTYNMHLGEIRLFLNGRQIIFYKNKEILFKDYIGSIDFLTDNFGQRPFEGKISNIKISRKANGFKILDSFDVKDINYFDKEEENRELVYDEHTTYMNNFSFELSIDEKYSEIIDKKSGIFDFEIDINDSFNKLDENYKKDLVEYLVNRIKPAHSNSIVRIKKDRC